MSFCSMVRDSTMMVLVWHKAFLQTRNQNIANPSFLALYHFSQNCEKQTVNKNHSVEKQSTTKPQHLANASLCWSQSTHCCPTNSTFVPPPVLSILPVSNNSRKADRECWHRASTEFPLPLHARTDKQLEEQYLHPVKKQRKGTVVWE